MLKYSKINENKLSLRIALKQILMILNESRFRIENDKLFNIHICTDLLRFHIFFTRRLVFFFILLNATKLCADAHHKFKISFTDIFLLEHITK